MQIDVVYLQIRLDRQLRGIVGENIELSTNSLHYFLPLPSLLSPFNLLHLSPTLTLLPPFHSLRL